MILRRGVVGWLSDDINLESSNGELTGILDFIHAGCRMSDAGRRKFDLACNSACGFSGSRVDSDRVVQILTVPC